MSGFSTRDVRRRCLVSVACAIWVGSVALASAGCSSGGAAGGSGSAEIGIETSQLFVTVENKAGAPLVNVTVAILSTSGQPFTKFLSRMENGEKRDVSLGDFSGKDGTPFSLRVVKPKAVRVSAEDVANKKHESEVAWR
jgi:hypothetical protein